MSVEKVAALPQKSPISDNGSHLHGLAGKLSSSRFIDQLQSAAPPTVTAGVHVESLSLPLTDAAPSAGTPEALTRAAYFSWLSTAAQPTSLVEGKLTTDAVIGHAKALLQHAADERGISIKRLLQTVRPSESERLPSHNASDATFSFQTQLLAPTDHGGAKVINFYLTRLSRRQWEVVAFRQDDVTTGFPYLSPPINAERLIIDPTNAEILSCVAMTIAKRRFTGSTQFLGGAERFLPVLAILALAAGLTSKISLAPLLMVIVLTSAILLIAVMGLLND